MQSAVAPDYASCKGCRTHRVTFSTDRSPTARSLRLLFSFSDWRVRSLAARSGPARSQNGKARPNWPSLPLQRNPAFPADCSPSQDQTKSFLGQVCLTSCLRHLLPTDRQDNL